MKLLTTFLVLLSFCAVYASEATDSGRQEIADRLQDSINVSANPCENFFQFACGGWALRHPVPPDATGDSTYKTVYKLKRDHIQDHLVDHFDDIDPTNARIPRLVRQGKMLFTNCMRDATTADWRQLLALFDTYGGWPVLQHSWQPVKTGWSAEALAGHIASHYISDSGSSAFWSAGTSRRGKILLQPGPPRRHDGAPVFNQTVFKRYVHKIATDAGVQVNQQQLDTDADELDQVGVRLKAIYRDSTTSPPKVANQTIDQAQAKWPYIDWTVYFSALAEDTLPMELVRQTRFEVRTPTYFDKLKTFYPSVSPRAAQNLLIYQIARAAYRHLLKADGLNSNLVSEVDTNTGTRSLLPEPKPEVATKAQTRKEKCFEIVKFRVPPAVYLLFQLSHSPDWQRDKVEAFKVINSVLGAWQHMIHNVTWLSGHSRSVAIQKVQAVRIAQFGFDPRLFDETFLESQFGGLQLQPTDGHVIAQLKLGRLNIWGYFQHVRPGYSHIRLEIPLDVNAYYMPSYNEILLPAAGMLTAPYFAGRYPKAANYAGLGFTVGHEMGHGFDPRGIRHGPHGEPSSWMTQSMQGFDNMARCLQDEYDNYCYHQGGQTRCIDGKKSAPDNMADNSGIVAAFRAYQARIAQEGPEPRLPGMMAHYTMEQVFFMNYGYTWCRSVNANWFGTSWPNAGHAPEDARAMVPDMNFEDFYKTFNCPASSHMHPSQPCRVWH